MRNGHTRQEQVLEELAGGPTTADELAEVLGISNAHVRIELNRARQAGLIKATKPVTVYGLTDYGRRVADWMGKRPAK